MAKKVHLYAKDSIGGAMRRITSVFTNGRTCLDTVRHAHGDGSNIHFDVDGLSGNTFRYLLIDLSDIINYKHESTGYIHIENIDIDVDTVANGAWKVTLGFLKNVDESNGDLWVIKHWSGTRKTGASLSKFLNLDPDGHRCTSDFVTTNDISTDDANYQSDTNMLSLLSPAVADTKPGDGDLILVVEVTAQTIDISVDIAYHSHA